MLWSIRRGGAVVAVLVVADRRRVDVRGFARRPRRRRRFRSRLRRPRRLAGRRRLQRGHVVAEAPTSGGRTARADRRGGVRDRRRRRRRRQRRLQSVRRRLVGMPNSPRRRRSGVSAARRRRRRGSERRRQLVEGELVERRRDVDRVVDGRATVESVAGRRTAPLYRSSHL